MPMNLPLLYFADFVRRSSVCYFDFILRDNHTSAQPVASEIDLGVLSGQMFDHELEDEDPNQNILV